jgi:hypothetical protein
MERIDLSEWNKWFKKYVEPVFIADEREYYYERIKQLQTPFYPKYWIAEKFYETIKDDNRFDEELKRYFAFLYSCGFFMEHIITFEEWINMNNWENPSSSEKISEKILDVLNKNEGVSILKNQLRWLPFLNQR